MLAMKTKMMFCTRCCVTKQEVEDTVIIQSGRPRHQTLKLHFVCAACLFLFTQWSPLRKGRMVQCVEYETKKPRRSIYTGSIPHNKKGKFPRPKTEAQYLHGFDSPQPKGIVLPESAFSASSLVMSVQPMCAITCIDICANTGGGTIVWTHEINAPTGTW